MKARGWICINKPCKIPWCIFSLESEYQKFMHAKIVKEYTKNNNEMLAKEIEKLQDFIDSFEEPEELKLSRIKNYENKWFGRKKECVHRFNRKKKVKSKYRNI
jgi:hypothetical protein